MADQQTRQEQDSHPPEASADPDQREQGSEQEEQSQPSPAEAKSGKADKKDPEVTRLERRKFHLDRALKASGRSADGKFTRAEAKPDEDDSEETEVDAEEAEEAEGKPTKLDAKTRAEVDAKVDKLKNGKHVRIAKDKLREQITKFEADKAAHAKQVAEDARINAAADSKYGAMAAAVVSYGNKDYRGTSAALEKLFGEPLNKVMRNIYDATKDGAASADLRHEIGELKSELRALREGGAKEKEQAENKAKDTRERASFDKRVSGHGLTALGDTELSDEAYRTYRESWDPDLEEYSLTPKQCADRVLTREQKRAERITGRRVVARETPARGGSNVREFRAPTGEKAYSSMNKEEKRKFHMDRALRQAEASKRERQRHA